MGSPVVPTVVVKLAVRVPVLRPATMMANVKPASPIVMTRHAAMMGAAVYAVCAQTVRGVLTKANVRAVRRVQGFVVAPVTVASATSFASIRVTAAMISALSAWTMLLSQLNALE